MIRESLGVHTIKTIGEKYGLTNEDEKIIDQMLEEWESLKGSAEEKMTAIKKMIRDKTHRDQIAQAFLAIIVRYTTKIIEEGLAL